MSAETNGTECRSHPRTTLEKLADSWGLDIDDDSFAAKMDDIDPLRHLREEFQYPLNGGLPYVDLSLVDPDHECVYMCGNSLGLMPKGVRAIMERQFDKWGKLGVHGHRHGELPWAQCDECVDEDMAQLVGARRSEIAVMNGLTVNIHLLLISFYRPTAKRHKVLLEDHAFPSDHYAVKSQVELHGYNPETSMICLKPREGEELLRQEDILRVIEEEGENIAVIMLPGVQYYTGQVLDMEAITKAGQAKGCYVGFDLAHAVGNIELFLHDWNVDFAAWCTYKYVNTGAGGIAGAFIHERFANNDFPKLLGWWGHQFESRFQMDNELQLSEGPSGYRVSNPPILLCVALRASLNVFNKTSLSELRDKSRLLTGYLEYLLERHLPKGDGSKPSVRVITPADPEKRGCQLSIMTSVPVKHAFDELMKRGVALDMREPNVIRVAPTPLYNSFTDVHRFVQLLHHALEDASS